MAARRRRTARPVALRLLEETYRFGFYQAVRLLEALRPRAARVGTGLRPDREPVRFSGHLGLDFPASDIRSLTPPREGETVPEMSVAFLSLGGAHGPLPAAYTEQILERLRHRDTASKAFLDMFLHRLIGIHYRIYRTHRIGFDVVRPDRTPHAAYLQSVLGLATPKLQDRTAASDRALLAFTGLLATRPRSMRALEILLSQYFGVRVRGIPFIGRWRRLEDDQVTALGRFGRNNRLGASAVLGGRIWDQEGAVELRIGPLSLDQFRSFLPEGDAFPVLCALTRYVLEPHLDFQVRLELAAREVVPMRLGGAGGPRLSWTTWLQSGPAGGNDDRVLLRVDWEGTGSRGAETGGPGRGPVPDGTTPGGTSGPVREAIAAA